MAWPNTISQHCALWWVSEDGPTFFAQEIHSVFDLKFFCPLFNSGGFYKGRSTYVSKKMFSTFQFHHCCLLHCKWGQISKLQEIKKERDWFLVAMLVPQSVFFIMADKMLWGGCIQLFCLSKLIFCSSCEMIWLENQTLENTFNKIICVCIESWRPMLFTE